jgi:hypothetical protein
MGGAGEGAGTGGVAKNGSPGKRATFQGLNGSVNLSWTRVYVNIVPQNSWLSRYPAKE